MAILEVVVAGNISGINLELIERMVAVLNRLEADWMRPGAIGVRLVDDAGIRALNRDYGGEDKATDVLSFDYRESEDETPPAEGELGDVIVSTETAARQAETAGTTTGEEVALLILHGILHIYGFDHVETADQEQLQELQASILKAAGVTYRKFEWKQ